MQVAAADEEVDAEAATEEQPGPEGMTAEMNCGNVFECYDEQADRRQYSKTIKVLDIIVKKTLKLSEDLAPLFATESRGLHGITKPPKSGKTAGSKEPDKDNAEMWKDELKEVVKRKCAL